MKSHKLKHVGFLMILSASVDGVDIVTTTCKRMFRCDDGSIGGTKKWLVSRERKRGCITKCTADPTYLLLRNGWCGGCWCDGKYLCDDGSVSGAKRWYVSKETPTGCSHQCVANPSEKMREGYACGTCVQGSTVVPSDVQLVAPHRTSGPIIAAITAYNWRNDQTWSDKFFELPIYSTSILDREKPEFWTYLLDEILLARLDVVLLHGRGCYNVVDPTNFRGRGSMCPKMLEGFVDAVERAGVEDIVRVGMFDDTGESEKMGLFARLLDFSPNFSDQGMYRGARNDILGEDAPTFDLADESNWQFFWDYNMKIWFDTIPSSLWFRIDGKPIIASWNLRDSDFSNQQGHTSYLLVWLKQQFQTRYGVEPHFILDRTWFEEDTTITTDVALGKHAWFSAASGTSYTYTTYNNAEWGVVAPGYRNSGSVPGCGASCREILRYGGATLDNGFKAGSNAKLIMLEGWVNMIESAGVYRSSEWAYPTQYINIVRKYSEPRPQSLRFEAEGADAFNDNTVENLGGQYANRSLDVGALAGGEGWGWYVGWTESGEWLQYNNVLLGCGFYRFTARVAKYESGATTIRLALDGFTSVVVPDTGGGDNYLLVHLGAKHMNAGTYDLRIVFETGGVNLDWFFLKRVTAVCEDP